MGDVRSYPRPVTDTRYGMVVVGGGPAALEAVRGYRGAGGTGRVRLVSDDSALPYERPPLSKAFLRGDVDEDELPMEDASFWTSRDVEVTLRTPAVRLDTARREVTVAGGELLAFETCVLATGSTPTRLPVPGADHPDVLLLRRIDQGRALRSAAEDARSAVVVGSGFIGCEAAASLALRGLRVTLVTQEPAPQEARLGADVGRRLAAWLEGLGVHLVVGSPVSALEDGRRVLVEGGPRVEGDLLLVAAGVAPRADLAEAAGLPVHDGRVVVDERMRTGADGVLAAGDVVWARNAAAGRHLAVEHWGEALAMGEVAGTTAAGGDAQWAQAPGFWSDIGGHVVKYAAWGDGFDEARWVDHPGGGFTVRYGRGGTTVGVLTHEADEDYEDGRELVEGAAPLA